MVSLHLLQYLNGSALSTSPSTVVHAAWLQPTRGIMCRMHSSLVASELTYCINGSGGDSSRVSSTLSRCGSHTLAPACLRRAMIVERDWPGCSLSSSSNASAAYSAALPTSLTGCSLFGCKLCLLGQAVLA